MSTVITPVPLATGISSHAQTQPFSLSVAPLIATDLHIICTADPAKYTPPLAPIQDISSPTTLFYDPTLDKILKRPQIPNYQEDTAIKATYIPSPTSGRVQVPISTSSSPNFHQNVEASIPSTQSA